MIRRYGMPLYRVPIDPGFGCPHREDDGTGGCTFCPADGSRARHTATIESISGQVQAGLAFARRRYKAEGFLAYIQAFTGTHAPPDRLQALLTRILDSYPFTALSVGTRPDCLPGETLDVLAKARARTDLWVELGIQTVHDETLRRIQRGHNWACSQKAIVDIHARGIPVAVHVILGLPGETVDHFRRTAARLGELPLAGIKIHNLHIVRGTGLEAEFREAPFALPDEMEYVEILIDFLRHLPDSLPIMRMLTDTLDRELVAPRWHMDKGAFLALLRRQMEKRGVRQGDLRRMPR